MLQSNHIGTSYLGNPTSLDCHSRDQVAWSGSLLAKVFILHMLRSTSIQTERHQLETATSQFLAEAAEFCSDNNITLGIGAPPLALALSEREDLMQHLRTLGQDYRIFSRIFEPLARAVIAALTSNDGLKTNFTEIPVGDLDYFGPVCQLVADITQRELLLVQEIGKIAHRSDPEAMQIAYLSTTATLIEATLSDLRRDPPMTYLHPDLATSYAQDAGVPEDIARRFYYYKGYEPALKGVFRPKTVLR